MLQIASLGDVSLANARSSLSEWLALKVGLPTVNSDTKTFESVVSNLCFLSINTRPFAKRE